MQQWEVHKQQTLVVLSIGANEEALLQCYSLLHGEKINKQISMKINKQFPL